MECEVKRHEILKGLPPYGPIYIPVFYTDHPSESFYIEGFVVRFISQGESWMANFTIEGTALN